MNPGTSGRPDARTQGDRAHGFSIEILRADGSGVLAVEPVHARDLADLRAEALWMGAARRGRPDLTLEEAVRGPFPTPEGSGGPALEGVTFAVGSRADIRVEVAFRLDCFLPVARRAVARLVQQGVLQLGDEYAYRLRPALPPAGSAGSSETGAAGGVRAAAPVDRTPPAFARHDLAPLLARAQAVDEEHALASDHAVVFARAVLERSRAIAERGIGQRPPLETGGILLGRRVACPRSGEAYVVVEEALEAQQTVAAEFSLEFSGATWHRFESVLRRRRAHPATAGQVLVGQFHVHPFEPDGGLAPCADCARRAVCTRSSARPSAEDGRWCRAVFHEAPWQLSLMFGLDARGQRRVELYGQRAGALARRGYHVVAELPELATTDGAAPAGRAAPPSSPPRTAATGDSPCPTT